MDDKFKKVESGARHMNAGEKTIEWLYCDLQIDQKWSARYANGFTWWADQNAQRIEITGEEFSDRAEEETFFIRVKTELLADVVLNEKTLSLINRELMCLASMSGPVYDAATGVLSLCSLVRTYESIRPWMSHLISMAAVLQLTEVRAMGPTLAEMIGATFATSGHPKNGIRAAPDELAEGGLHALITAEGAKPCAWTQQFLEAEEYIHAPPSLLSNGDQTGFTAEFPWDDFSSLCRFNGDEVHPRYLHGLLLRQSFPLAIPSDMDGVKLALELNTQELDKKPTGYGLGSYCRNHGCLNFVSFFPNFISKFAHLRNLYYSAVSRAHAMSTRFAGDDWSGQFVSSRSPKATSATEIMARGYLQPMSDPTISASIQALSDENEAVFASACDALPRLVGEDADRATALLIERWKHAETKSAQDAAGRGLDRIGADPQVVAPALIKGSQHPEDLKEFLVDLTIIGVHEVAEGTTDFAEWSEAMLAKVPLDSLRPFLRMVYDNSRKIVQIINKHFDSDTEVSHRDLDAWFTGLEETIYDEFYKRYFS